MTIEYYEKIMNLFKKRLIVKHKLYGLGYLEVTKKDMRMRLNDELYELDEELNSFNQDENKIIEEALDVAIVSLLIGDMARIEKERNEIE
jgi:NTP pyrophosphatase (non-canonical NTP hydrolase)